MSPSKKLLFLEIPRIKIQTRLSIQYRLCRQIYDGCSAHHSSSSVSRIIKQRIVRATYKRHRSIPISIQSDQTVQWFGWKQCSVISHCTIYTNTSGLYVATCPGSFILVHTLSHINIRAVPWELPWRKQEVERYGGVVITRLL